MTEIEIFSDENSISFSDEHHDSTLEFFPETKEFKSTLSLKDDVYYRNELYEYRLSANPIEVFVRLIERSDEPPMHYVVKDGVVLGDEIKKDNKFMRQDFIDGLKKDVTWQKIELPGGYAQLFFILSLHPEIISKNEYRKFLRETEQRIKTGLAKIEEGLRAKDKTGLQILEGEYGKQLWYPDANKMSDEERDKKFDYIEKTFNEPLFNEKSPEYCGISKYEFQESPSILKHMDKLLNEKEKSDPQKKASEEKKSPVRWLGYAWTVIVNLITIGVVLAIYGKVSANFEVIVVSILILTYLSAQSFSMIYGKTIVATAFGLDNEFKRLRKLLKDEPRKDELEELKEAKKKVDNSMIKMYINAGFLFIIYLIALFHLFGSL